jgi:hypothetical protein
MAAKKRRPAATGDSLTSNAFHPRNPRVITPPQLSALDEALREFGDLGGIVFNRRTGHLAGGNQRVTTFMSDPELPVVITNRLAKPDRTGTVAYGHVEMHGTRFSYREVDWDERRELAANVAANKHGGEWDTEELTKILQELSEGDPQKIALTGFEPGDLERMLKQIQVPTTNRDIDEGKLAGGQRTVTCPACQHEFTP